MYSKEAGQDSLDISDDFKLKKTLWFIQKISQRCNG